MDAKPAPAFVGSKFRKAAARLVLALIGLAAVLRGTHGHAEGLPHEVLAFYYGWWGNPAVSGRWVHWKNVDQANERIENSTHFPVFGDYDSHNPAVVDHQMQATHAAGITGLIASWWGQGSFEDRGLSLLLDAAGRHGIIVTAYYEKIVGEDA